MNKKRVYVAGPWVDREAAQLLAHKIAEQGHQITHAWWAYEGKGEEHETEEFKQDCAIKDLNGVLTSNIVVVLNTVKSEGKAVEQGIALAMHIPIVVLTPGEKPTSNIFHSIKHAYQHTKTVEETLEAVNGK